MYSHSALLCSAAKRTFVHSLSDFWNPSHVQNDPSDLLSIYFLGQQDQEKKKSILEKYSDSSSNNSLIPIYIQSCLQIAKTARQSQPAVGCRNHVGTMWKPCTVWQSFSWGLVRPNDQTLVGWCWKLAGKCLLLATLFLLGLAHSCWSELTGSLA